MHRGRTIMAMACPAAPAQRQVLRISGPAARDIAAELTRGSAEPFSTASGVQPFELSLEDCTVPATLWWRRAPRTATGEDCLEIHCVGAPLIAKRLQNALGQRGLVEAMPGEFTRRALENGKLDLVRAEAVGALVAAESEADMRRALFVLEGGLARRLATFTQAIHAVLVPLELGFDFDDADVVIALPPEAEVSLVRVARELRALAGNLATTQSRSAIPLVVLTGPANAGKSTLFNALTQRDAAIASAHPGTTRDAVEATVATGDGAIRLVDTAGTDVVPTFIDEEAQRKRLRLVEAADLVLEVRAPWQEQLAADPKRLLVLTHADLNQGPVDALCVSGRTGQGLPELRAAIAERLAAQSSGSVASARQAAHCLEAALALDRAASLLANPAERELVAADLHAALQAIAAISGADAPQRLLDRIFSTFCIGK